MVARLPLVLAWVGLKGWGRGGVEVGGRCNGFWGFGLLSLPLANPVGGIIYSHDLYIHNTKHVCVFVCICSHEDELEGGVVR